MAIHNTIKFRYKWLKKHSYGEIELMPFCFFVILNDVCSEISMIYVKQTK